MMNWYWDGFFYEYVIYQQLSVPSFSIDVFSSQKDFDVRELREFNRQIMQQIGDVIQKHPDIGEAVNMYFSQVRKLSRSVNNH